MGEITWWFTEAKHAYKGDQKIKLEESWSQEKQSERQIWRGRGREPDAERQMQRGRSEPPYLGVVKVSLVVVEAPPTEGAVEQGLLQEVTSV